MESAPSGAASVSATASCSNIDDRSTPAHPRAHLPIAVRLPEMATIEMQQRLPRLDDDGDIGVEKEHLVPVDGGADLKFRGTLIASAAPGCHGQDRWREYRVYRTGGGQYVFSDVGRSVRRNEDDRFDAAIWNPGTPVQKQGKTEWTEATESGFDSLGDALTYFFEFDQLAKQLYAKLKVDTSRRIE